jgi:DNA mismatch repair ATPase MutS
LWDWQYIYRIEKWQLNHKVEFGNWLDCIANFDALISFANLKYNNPDFTFPILSQEEFEFSALNIGHPLLSSEVRVSNDFEILLSPRYAIVTGANMAGKSTFLRTIATNIVLAGCGAPVCAKQLKFTPLPLHSSMRTEDSLMKNESYFFAELKRLQRITQALDKGEKLFIILDEILRGTNSEDKRKGSIGFVKKITQKRAHGLVATHDLELARLAEQQPDIFKALCFEVAIENNQLHFDYKLQSGVTQNMNASFLMKQMGIIEG